jgi:GT2 family glycosyltransferase
MSADVAVVIPQFNQLALTRRCLESLHMCGVKCLELLVADDGSDPTELRCELPWLERHARVLQFAHRGLTATWNAAAQQTEASWLVFLNNDCLAAGDWIDPLLEPLRTGSALLTAPGWRNERFLPSGLRAVVPRRGMVSGWCLAVSRNLFLSLGGFDESLELYFSDTDLQLRLLTEVEHPHPLLAVEGLPLSHAGHATAHRLCDQSLQWERDRQRFVAKWASRHSTGHAGHILTMRGD